MATNTQTPAVGDKGVFVVVNGYVYDADASGSSKDILYISANEAAESKLGDNFTVEAKAYFTDGTNKVVKIDMINGEDITKLPKISLKAVLVLRRITLQIRCSPTPLTLTATMS